MNIKGLSLLVKTAIIAWIAVQASSCMMMYDADHHGYHHHASHMNVIHDPVCGAVISDTAASLKYAYRGMTYYFDTPECQKIFQKNPENFVYPARHNELTIPLIVAGTVAMTAMMVLMMGFWIRGAW